MFKDSKLSPYAKMYLVTPAIYEKLKKCIDSEEIEKVNKKTQTENQEVPVSNSDAIIQAISTDEIAPEDPPIQVVNDNSYDPPVEHVQNVPGPSSREHHIFTDPNVTFKNINVPVQPPEFRNGNYYINPGDYDVDWVESKSPPRKRRNIVETPPEDDILPPTPPSSPPPAEYRKRPRPKVRTFNRIAERYTPRTRPRENPETRHMGTQVNVDNTAKYTQTDIDGGVYYVRKPQIENKNVPDTENQTCSGSKVLPLAKCQKKTNLNTENSNINSITRSNMNSTIRQKVPDSEKPHSCKICLKKFLRKSNLTRHVSQVHKNIINNIRNYRRDHQNNLNVEFVDNDEYIDDDIPEQQLQNEIEYYPPQRQIEYHPPQRQIEYVPNQPRQIEYNPQPQIEYIPQQRRQIEYVPDPDPEPMDERPTRSRKRSALKQARGPTQSKYRQLMESGYKRTQDEANLKEYQEKKRLRGLRPRNKPKRFDSWGL